MRLFRLERFLRLAGFLPILSSFLLSDLLLDPHVLLAFQSNRMA
jgi:hypothetical protein